MSECITLLDAVSLGLWDVLFAWRTVYASSLNDRPFEVVGVSPMTTLLDWLRDRRGLKGTKEGCAEGDCGACTVVLERATAEARRSTPVSPLLGQMDGQAVRTVEGLWATDGAPHPVQATMVDHATQCGFCTPGFVMSAYAFAVGRREARRRESMTRWPATFAAAPAIGRSSRR